MNFDELIVEINKKVPNAFESKDGISVIYVTPERWIEVAKLLKNDEKFKFDYLMCITSYDVGDNVLYGAAYNLYSTSKLHYLEVRIEIDDGQTIPSVSSLWRTADWHEREAFDMMGLKFDGHPDMKRILLSDDWEGHPLRKNYKEPDYYHGLPVPKDKSYWE